jgi:hypothetical protein
MQNCSKLVFISFLDPFGIEVGNAQEAARRTPHTRRNPKATIRTICQPKSNKSFKWSWWRHSERCNIPGAFVCFRACLFYFFSVLGPFSRSNRKWSRFKVNYIGSRVNWRIWIQIQMISLSKRKRSRPIWTIWDVTTVLCWPSWKPSNHKIRLFLMT